MTINSVLTIISALLSALITLFGAVQTQKAFNKKKKKRAAKKRKNRAQIMETLAENEIPNFDCDKDILDDFPVVEQMLLDNIRKSPNRPSKYAKAAKSGKYQFEILTDDSISQKQQHIG